jgi:hypothetical protein
MAARRCVIALLLVLPLTACAAADKEQPPATSTPSPSPTSATPRPLLPEAMLPAPLQPLWPFTSPEAVRTWQRGHRSGGHSPWHLDPAQTALSFTRGFLGFDGIDQVTSRKINGADAHIGVGARTEGDRTSTAAIIHLKRVGTGADAPWEVVGTDDTDLTLTIPAYGSHATSPLKVGGKITGVDESVRVQIRRAGTDTPVGTSCCLSTGGTASPWSVTVTFTATPKTPLTIVASTGASWQKWNASRSPPPPPDHPGSGSGYQLVGSVGWAARPAKAVVTTVETWSGLRGAVRMSMR